MALINEINADLLRTLSGAGSGRASSSNSGSNINGLGVSATFGGEAVDLRSGLASGAEIFSRSVLRLNNAVSALRATEGTLKELLSITKEMLDLADEAADLNATSEAFSRFESKFSRLIAEFKDVAGDATNQTVDLLEKDDIETALELAGLDLNKATKVADIFERLAGLDGRLGTERIVVDDVTVSNSRNKTTVSNFSTTIEGSDGAYPAGGESGNPEEYLKVGDGTFQKTQTYDVGHALTDMVSADIDGDGNLDLVTSNTAETDVRILFGNGDGSFAAETTVNDSSLGTAKVGDFDGDGKADLAALDVTNGKILVSFGNGDGTFGGQVSLAGVVTTEDEIVIGDLNNDGSDDIVVNDSAAEGARVYISQDDRTFDAGSNYDANAALTDTENVTLADVDEDGNLDIITANDDNTTVSVLIGNGDGTFGAYTSFDTYGQALSVKAADVNADGNLDLISVGATATADVLLGNADGSFSASISFSVGGTPQDLIIQDLDGDGYNDLVVADNADNTLSYLLGNGDGTFNARSTLATGTAPSEVVSGDFNNDGVLDIASANSTTQDINVYLSQTQNVNRETAVVGDGTFSSVVSYDAAASQPVDNVLADFDGDGVLDVATASYSENGVRVFLGNSNDTFGEGTLFSAGVSTNVVQAGDVNRDGIIDLVTTNAGDSSATVLIGNGDGTFSAATSFALSNPARDLELKDFNQDGNLDIATANNTGGTANILLGNGDGTFAARDTFFGEAGLVELTTADFDGDGVLDLAYANYDNDTISIALGNSDGSFKAQTSFGVTDGPVDILAGDFNGDGEADVVTVDYVTNTATVFAGNGDGTVQAGISYSVSPTIFNVESGDLNGDGVNDLIFGSQNPVVLLGNQDGSFSAPTSYTSTGFSEQVSVADITGDGVLDIVSTDSANHAVNVFQGDQGQKTIQVGSGAVLDGTVYTGGPSTTAEVAVGDFDNDGHQDIISISSTSSENPFIYLGNANGSFNAPTSVSLDGAVTRSSVAVGGLNDDLFSDFVVDAGASGVTVNISNGDGTFSVFQASTAGNADQIELFDLDEDGNLDILVRNDSTNGIDVLLGNGNGTFNAETNFASSDIADLQIADVDQDSLFDIVTTDSSGNVRVLSGNGDGSFNAESGAFGSLASATGLVTGDFDEDGVADAIVYSDDQNQAGFLKGNNDGTFQAVSTISTVDAIDIKAIDVNGDGYLDLGVADSDGLTGFALGNGDGSFTATYVTGTTGATPSTLATGDFNLDGVEDIALGFSSEAGVEVFLGNGYELRNRGGDGTLQTAVTLEPNSVDSMTSAVFADFNEDGFQDIFTNELTGANHSGILRLGNSDGTFQAGTTLDGFPQLLTSSNVVVGDFDGDGNFDISAQDYQLDDDFILYGNGNGTFDAGVTEANKNNKIVADVNGDGRDDIISSGAGNNFSVFLANGDRSFKQADYDAGAVTSPVVARDFNNDGITDVALATGTNELKIAIGNGDGTFLAPGATISATVNHDSVTSGDINNDGYEDLLIQDDGAGFSILLGNGDGTFSAATSVADAALLTSTQLADLDEDGNLDIIAGESGGVRLFSGNGDGSFAAGVSYSLVTSPLTDFSVYDADGDSVNDVIGVSQTTISRLSGTPVVPSAAGTFSGGSTVGTGTFQGVKTYDGGVDIRYIASGDFDEDGNTDIVAAGDTANNTNILFGNGDGSFSSPTSFISNSPTTSVAVGDFNNDDNQDFITGTSEFGGSITIHQGNGDGTFNAAISITGIASPDYVQLADVNGDNNDDVIAISDTGTGEVQVFLSNGDGSFDAAVTLDLTGIDPRELRIADLDGDTNLDIAVLDDDSTVQILSGNGDGTFLASTSFRGTGGRGATGIELTDLDGDNDLDIVTQTAGKSDDFVNIFISNGDGSFEAVRSYEVEKADGDRAHLSVADINGDSNIDIVTTLGDTNSMEVLLGNGDGTFALSVSMETTGERGNTALLDVTGDGVADLLSVDQTNNKLEVRIGNSTEAGTAAGIGTFSPKTTFGEIDLDFIASGDINEDGNNDIIGVDSSSGTAYLLTGNSDASFNAPVSFATGLSSASSVTIGDLDNDNNLDFAVGNDGSGADPVQIFFGNGDGNFSAAISSDAEGRFIGIADVTGDSIADLISTDDTDSITILTSNGDGTFLAPTTVGLPAGVDPRQLIVTDVDGDTDNDILFVEGTSGATARVLLGNNDGTFAAAVSYSLQGTTAGAGIAFSDVTGDGTADIIAKSDGNIVNILAGNGDGTFQARTTLQGGSGSSLGNYVSSADLNGDGQNDIVETSNSDDRLTVFLSNGDGSFVAGTSYSTSDSGLGNVLLTDIDGDNVSDIVSAEKGLSIRRTNTNESATFERTRSESEIITARAPNEKDPLKGQSLSNRATSIIARDMLVELKEIIEDDIEDIQDILKDVQGALQFARAGTLAFDDASTGTLNISSAELLVNDIIKSIRANTSAANIAAHSSLDAKLAQELLSGEIGELKLEGTTGGDVNLI